MYSREQVKAVADKVFNMAKADAVEVDLNGGERSGTRWANSSITVNLVQFDRRSRRTSASARRRAAPRRATSDDAALKAMVDEAVADSEGRRSDNPNLPELLGPQEYIPVDAALPTVVNFGPGERARMVEEEHRRLARRWASLGVRLHPEDRPDQLHRQLEGPVRLLPRPRKPASC